MNGEHPLPNFKEKDIFWEALKLSIPEDVNAYLNQACAGDQNLRFSVESLLKNHKKDDLLENPTEKIGEKIGDTIDDYLLLEKIGEGGCGIVFRARQHKPIQRVVALKVVKREVATGKILERFQAEIQAQASIPHQNIAKVFDAGTTKDGLPYFTMEFVEGKRITDYADKYRLTIPERLELFGKVYKTIQFAHEKGFIHRDIKPSNILIYEESGEHIPKVIDFGIAKAIDDDGFNAFATRTGQIVGTPAYMSPEQAGLKKTEIDARTDIYSLGVLLYELLIGYQPFDMKGMKLDDAVKTIREKTPSPPSDRIHTEEDKSFFKIAKKRHLSPSRLKRMLRGGLDRIVMKCLEKKPALRYESVEHVEADIQSFIESVKNQNFNNVIRVTALILVLVVGTFAAIHFYNNKTPVESPPDDTTAAGLLTNLVYPKLYGKNDQYLIEHQTEVGRQVWDWLIQQAWFKDKGIGNITERLNGGTEQSLVIKYDTIHGYEKIAPIFYRMGGILKFHDIHIYEMMGDKYDMDLSVKILNPYRFETNYCQRNPGKCSQNPILYTESLTSSEISTPDEIMVITINKLNSRK